MTADLGPPEPTEVAITLRVTDSSQALKDRVRRFIERAERVEAHPLFGTSPAALNLRLYTDRLSGGFAGGDIQVAGTDPDAWELLATRERSLVFNETDPLHLTKLAASIGKEHVGLRVATKNLNSQFRLWKAKPLFAVKRLVEDPAIESPRTGNLLGLQAYPVGTDIPGVDLDSMMSDFQLAVLYLNSQLWHADSDKFDEWDRGSATLKDLWRTAAEGRAISGAALVGVAANFVRFCRANGYDF